MSNNAIKKSPKKEELKRLVDYAVNIVGDRWSLHLIGNLAFGKSPIRFNELMRVLSPISSRTLSAKLTRLTEFEIVRKEIVDASPPYTIYSLTEKGMDFVGVLMAMADWSKKWQA
jgi:DNA-binding HxlR family transcriptional regulator